MADLHKLTIHDAAELLAQGRAREAVLRPSDLGSGFRVGNALRGLMPAVLLP